MDELAILLKSKRENMGSSLQKISESIRISSQILKDIENNNLEAYRGDEQYVKMYIRKYALYLGLDPDYCVSLYINDNKSSLDDVEDTKPTSSSSLKSSFNKKNNPRVYTKSSIDKYIKIALVIVLTIASIAAIWFAFDKFVINRETGFTDDKNPIIDGEINDPDPTEDPVDDPDKTGEDEEPTGEDETPVNTEVKVNRIGDYSFEVIIPANLKTLNFSGNFADRTWVEAYINGWGNIEGWTNKFVKVDESQPKMLDVNLDTSTLGSIRMIVTTGHDMTLSFSGVEVPLTEVEKQATRLVFNFDIKVEGVQ